MLETARPSRVFLIDICQQVLRESALGVVRVNRDSAAGPAQ